MMLIDLIMAWIGKLLRWEPIPPPIAPTMPQEPSKPPEPPPTIPESEPVTQPVLTPRATLDNFCLAIRDFEGKPGDANYKNNNPGNCRWNPSGYLPIYGNVRRSPAGFAIFPTYELGMLYLRNMLKGMIHKRPNETILQFLTRYAPPSENDTVAYTHYICARLGIRPSTLMGTLV